MNPSRVYDYLARSRARVFDWVRPLTDEQYRILRKEGTERAFCGTLLDNKIEGVYTCAACGLPLYTSDTKFNSGTGWPSFFKPIGDGNIIERPDKSYGMVRTEIECGASGVRTTASRRGERIGPPAARE